MSSPVPKIGSLNALSEHLRVGAEGQRVGPEGTVVLLDRAGQETGCHELVLGLRVRWFRFPREVISVAVRWYLRFGLSYRDVEELLAERGVTVDHVHS